MTEELKPCPFCGQKVDLIFNGHAGHSPTGQEWWITCHNDACLYDNGVYSVKSASAAMLAWNARPVEDALRSELAALRAKWESVPWGDIVESVWVALHCGNVIDIRNQEESAFPEAEGAKAWLDDEGLWDKNEPPANSFDPDYQALWESVPWAAIARAFQLVKLSMDMGHMQKEAPMMEAAFEWIIANVPTEKE